MDLFKTRKYGNPNHLLISVIIFSQLIYFKMNA